jgi:hypothetical protein
LACADDDSIILYLLNFDTTIPNLDIVDDFHTVKNNVMKKQGQTYHFGFGDYIGKTLLDLMNNFFDELDEVDINYLHNTTCSIL